MMGRRGDADDEQPLLLSTEAAADSPGTVPAGDTYWMCVANLSKVIIGAGMMAIPQAFHRVGWVAGTSMLVGVALLTYATLALMLQGSDVTGARASYAQLARVLCGRTVMQVLQLSILAFCAGFCVVYLVVIRDILVGPAAAAAAAGGADAPGPAACTGLLCELLGLHPDPRLVIVAVAGLVVAPLLLLRTMDRLAALNVVGVGAIAALACVAAGLGAHSLLAGSAHAIPMLPQWRELGPTPGAQLRALASVVPVIIAAMVAHQSLHPLMPLLQPYSDARMKSVIRMALLVSFSVFLTLAVGANLVWGSAVSVNVLDNLSVAGLEPLTGGVLARLLSWSIRGGYALALLASFLLYMQPLRASVSELIWAQEADVEGPDTRQRLADEATAGLLPVVGEPLQYSRSDPGRGTSSSSGTSMRASVPGSAFAAPGVQAAAAAAGVQLGAGSTADAATAARVLSACDSFDNPRAGSFSRIHFGGRASSLHAAAQQPQQQHPEHQPPPPVAWQLAEQRWYFPLTYSLLAVMVVLATAVPNIWVALSAIGDLASTIEAFVVPGLIGIVLATCSSESSERHGGSSAWWADGAVGGCAVVLGLALFLNGVLQRLL